MEARKTQEIVTTFSAFRGRWLRRVRQVLHNRHTYVQKETRQAIAEHTATAAAAKGTTHLSIDRSLAWFDYTLIQPVSHSAFIRFPLATSEAAGDHHHHHHLDGASRAKGVTGQSFGLIAPIENDNLVITSDRA